MKTRIVAELLPAHVGLAVVAEKDHDGIVCKAVGFQLLRISPTLRSSSVAASRYCAQSARATG